MIYFTKTLDKNAFLRYSVNMEVCSLLIREKLKEIDLKLYEFAKELRITRPTLNVYIELYEKGEKIPKEKYQFIFDRLFHEGLDDKEAFINELNRVHHLLERDENLGVLELNVESTDLMASVLENVREDLAKDDYNAYVYKFVNMLITSYRKEKVFVDFMNYFLYLNGVLKIEEIAEDEKPFISNCFKLMHRDKNGMIETDYEYLDMFISRIKEIQENAQKIVSERTEDALKRRIEEELNKKVQKQLSLGVDAEEIDYDKLIDSIDLSKDK